MTVGLLCKTDPKKRRGLCKQLVDQLKTEGSEAMRFPKCCLMLSGHLLPSLARLA